jgi:hypothetical protein
MNITYEIKHHARKNAVSVGKTLNAHAFSQQKNSLAFSFLSFCFFVSVEYLLWLQVKVLCSEIYTCQFEVLLTYSNY